MRIITRYEFQDGSVLDHVESVGDPPELHAKWRE